MTTNFQTREAAVGAVRENLVTDTHSTQSGQEAAMGRETRLIFACGTLPVRCPAHPRRAASPPSSKGWRPGPPRLLLAWWPV